MVLRSGAGRPPSPRHCSSAHDAVRMIFTTGICTDAFALFTPPFLSGSGIHAIASGSHRRYASGDVAAAFPSRYALRL